MFKDVRKCEVCGEIKPVQVCSSMLGAVSFAYCKDCLEAGLEPYGALIGFMSACGLTYDNVNESYVELIDRCVVANHKTLDQFNQEVKDESIKFDLEMEEYYKREETNQTTPTCDIDNKHNVIEHVLNWEEN